MSSSSHDSAHYRHNWITHRFEIAERLIYIVLDTLLGLIAVVRRVFVLTAQFAGGQDAHTMPFDHFVIELGALSGLIPVFAIALGVLRRSEKRCPNKSWLAIAYRAALQEGECGRRRQVAIPRFYNP